MRLSERKDDMQDIPNFRVEEDWGTNGDVTILFEDNVPYALQENIARRLQRAMQSLALEKRCTYKLQKAIESYFVDLVSLNKLRWSPFTRQWVWSNY